jgi:4-amino-4-deoxy-L-arabinose transferase-like glycosyltransferase
MRSRGCLLLVLAVGLLVRLANISAMSQHPMAEYQFRAPDADMSLAYDWSARIVGGDVLGREPVHQYTMWMREIASLETWERWWGGAHIFHQAPLYAYMLAAFRFLGGDQFWPIALCQALLGLTNVTLVFVLAKRIFGDAVAVLAALGAALYGPFQLHELFLLRDTLSITVSLLMLWALIGCDDGKPRRWVIAGFLLAVAILCREATLLFAPLVVLWMFGRLRTDRRALGSASLSLLIGLGVGFAPLVVRNIVVGAPPLSLSTRAIEAFIYGNAPGSAGFGWQLPTATRPILEQANGHLGAAIRLTLASYDGDWRSFFALQILKLRAIFASHEATDNINWYYFADRLIGLRFSLHFEHVLGLGLVGLWLARRSGARHRILCYFLAAALLGLMSTTVVGRYRLPAIAVLLIYAGVTLHWAAQRIARREWSALALGAGTVIGVTLVSTNLLRAAEVLRYPPREYASNAVLFYQRGQIDEACAELRRGLEKASTRSDHAALPPQYITILARPYVSLAHSLRRDGEAVDVLERLASSFPVDSGLEELIGVVYRDGLNRPDEAARHFERARAAKAG